MDISIRYCTMWNYLPEASRVEAEIKKSHPDAKVTLKESGGGVFDITFNGKLIYSMKNMQEQRFPEIGEISKLLGKGNTLTS